MRVLQRITLVLLLTLSAACAGTATRGAHWPRPGRDLITQEQMRDAGYLNAYEAVEALRSNWLWTRGVDSFRRPGQVQVYRDDMRVGGVETLRAIGTGDLTYIRYYDGTAATGRWGLDHGHGVIFVSSRPL